MSPLQIFIHPVGAGHAVHVFTPDDRVIIIDTGSSENCSPLDWLRGITDRIDRLIISHPHGDHIQEIDQLRRFNSIVAFERTPGLSEAAVRESNQGRYAERLDTFFELDRRWRTPLPVGTPAGTGTTGLAVETFYAPGTGLLRC